jgi:predicted Fe-Mo cluster-binding NifX family protein
MKLCIPSTGKDIEAQVNTAFGRAPYFLIVDTDTDATDVIENTADTQGHGAGIAAAQLVSDKDVDGVITGHIGPNALNAFRAAGIRLFVGATSKDTIKEVLAKFKKGEFQEATAPSDVPPCGPGLGRGLGRGMGRGRCRQD